MADGGTGPTFLRVNEHSISCAAPHRTHLSSAVWVAALLTLAARVMARVSFPAFCAVPEYVFRVITGIWRSRCAPIICVPIIGAVLFLLLSRQRNDAERRLRLDGQIAVCFQNGQSQIQKFISHYITALQKTSPTCRALSKADHMDL